MVRKAFENMIALLLYTSSQLAIQTFHASLGRQLAGHNTTLLAWNINQPVDFLAYLLTSPLRTRGVSSNYKSFSFAQLIPQKTHLFVECLRRIMASKGLSYVEPTDIFGIYTNKDASDHNLRLKQRTAYVLSLISLRCKAIARVPCLPILMSSRSGLKLMLLTRTLDLSL